MKALSEVLSIADDADNVLLDKQLDGILIERAPNGEASDAATLNCIVISFRSIISAQRKLEGNKNPTMYLVLLFFDHV